MQNETKPRVRMDDQTQAKIRSDGWANVLSGLNQRQDVASRTSYERDALLSKNELESIFEGDGLGRRVVEMPAEEMTRRWFRIEGENTENGAVMDFLESHKVKASVTEALVWSRLYGGAVILRLLNDGGDLEDALDRNRLREIIGYRVFDRHDITWTYADYGTDPTKNSFNRPEFYTIQPKGGAPFRVHHSRLTFIDGKRLPADLRQRNNGWGASVIQGGYAHLKRYGASLGYNANIVRDFVQAVLSVKGLQKMIASGNDNLVKDRLQLLDLSRSVLNAVVMDADGESYEKKSSSVAGLADLHDRFERAVASAFGIPVTKLFSMSPGGLNATGEYDLIQYYDTLSGEQGSVLGPVLEDLIRDVYTADKGPTRGVEPEQWSIKFETLYQPTDKELAETRNKQSETDKNYIETGVLTAEEVADSRFGGGEYSFDTKLAGEGTVQVNGPDENNV